jgi:hypothetical protein
MGSVRRDAVLEPCGSHLVENQDEGVQAVCLFRSAVKIGSVLGNARRCSGRL